MEMVMFSAKDDIGDVVIIFFIFICNFFFLIDQEKNIKIYEDNDTADLLRNFHRPF